MRSRIFYIIKKEFIQAIRDRRTLFIIFASPIIQLIVFGYVATTEVRHISLAVFDQDRSPLSRQLVDEFRGSRYFDLKYYISSPREVQMLLDGGSAAAALVIGKDFEKKVLRSEPAPVQVVFDGSDANSAIISGGYVASILELFSRNIMKDRLSLKGIDLNKFGSFKNEPRVWFNEELKSVNFMVPGTVAMVLLMSTMILSALGIVREKEYGTLEQLIVTPIKPHELLIGKMVPYIIITFIQVALSIFVAVYWFNVPFRGDILVLLSLCLLFLLPTLGLGLFISLVSRTQFQAFMTAYLVMLPSIMLSGFIFPINNMPWVIQQFTLLLPLRYFLEIVRGIFLKGIGIKYLWKDIWPLIILGALIFTISVSRFRKKIS